MKNEGKIKVRHLPSGVDASRHQMAALGRTE